MPAKLRDHGKAGIRRDLVDRCRDIAQVNPWLDGGEARLDGGLGRVDEALPLAVYRADAEHARGVGEVAVADGRHVDVDDVALLQDVVLVGNAMAHDFVDGRAHALGKALVVEVSRDGVVLDAVVVDPLVDLCRRDARLDVRGDVVERADVDLPLPHQQSSLRPGLSIPSNICSRILKSSWFFAMIVQVSSPPRATLPIGFLFLTWAYLAIIYGHFQARRGQPRHLLVFCTCNPNHTKEWT